MLFLTSEAAVAALTPEPEVGRFEVTWPTSPDLGKRCKKLCKCLFTYFTYSSLAKLSSLLCSLVKAFEFPWHRRPWKAYLKSMIILWSSIFQVGQAIIHPHVPGHFLMSTAQVVNFKYWVFKAKCDHSVCKNTPKRSQIFLNIQRIEEPRATNKYSMNRKRGYIFG